jgi:hypothetical protein
MPESSGFILLCNWTVWMINLFIDSNSISRLHDIRNERQGRRFIKKDPPLVNDTVFRLEYWWRFPVALRRRIQVDLAYVDIMGVIKGAASLDTNLEPLTRDTYTAKRWKLAPNFTRESERNAVYSLYESYEKQKKARGEFDDVDRVIRIFKSLRRSPEIRQEVEELLHEIYVDGKN